VEPQVPGSVYRLLFLDGELLDVVRRDPPHVTGDGSSTVRELILAENQRRLAARGDLGLQPITATLDGAYALAGQGLGLGSVPAAATRVRVRNVTNQSGPSDSHTISEPLADELVREARSSVQALGLRLAGVDVITSDLNRPLAETGGALIEVNGGPGLHHHYLVSDPSRAVHVCDPVLRRALGLT
jgi:cyanophycin synthetase